MAVFLALALAVSASLLTDTAATLNLKERPVAKVLRMLEEMQGELEKEKEADQELYNKLSCWCETNGKDKTAAIAKANSMIEGLSSDIDGLTSRTAQLEENIASLKSEIAKNDAALRKADAMRQKDLGEFTADEKDMMQSIQALSNAVTVLSKHHESFLQSDSAANEVSSAERALKTALLHALSKARLSKASRSQVESFLQQPAGFQSYAPASGQIFGILKQMKETFESNLSDSQKEEVKAAKDFADLKASKTKEMDSAKAMVDSKTQELAQTEEDNAAAKQNKADTEAALAADTKFLVDLKERCANADAEFEERTKARALELKAVAETIALLNSDEAHDMFGKTLGFVQMDSQTNTDKSRRERAAGILRTAAEKTGNTQLMQFATMAKLAGFEKVKDAVKTMIDELAVEQKQEVEHRDYCVEEFAQNEKQTAIANDEMTDLQAKIADLTSTIDTLTKELADHEQEVAETKLQMKRAGEDREAANAEFQQTVADQRAATQILTMALNRMKEVYGFVQQEPGAAAPPPPQGFDTYKKNEKSGGVLGMIQEIIDESKTMERDALNAEADSQAAYESFTKNGNASIKALLAAIRDKTEKKATASADFIMSKESLSKTLKELESLNEYKGTLHTSCDFVMKNFSLRQEKRSAEIEALRNALNILSGMA
jgi:chromosome segregation ATPase